MTAVAFYPTSIHGDQVLYCESNVEVENVDVVRAMLLLPSNSILLQHSHTHKIFDSNFVTDVCCVFDDDCILERTKSHVRSAPENVGLHIPFFSSRSW